MFDYEKKIQKEKITGERYYQKSVSVFISTIYSFAVYHD